MNKKIYFVLMVFLLFASTLFSQTPFIKMTNYYVNNNVLSMSEGVDTSIIYYAEGSSFGKLNKSGINSWYKYYSFPSGQFYCSDLMKISDTTYCTVGSYNSKGTSMIINKDGTIKYSRSYTLIGGVTNEVLMSSDRFLFLSTISNTPEFYLTKTDYTGSIVSTKKISLPAGSYAPSPTKTLIKLNPNLYIISLTNNSLPVYQFDVATIAVDSSLNVVWSKLMEGEHDEYPMSGVAVGAYYYVASKTNSYGVGMNDIMVTCMDTAGNFIWNKTFGTSSNDEFPFGMSLDKDSTLLIAGAIQDTSLSSSGLMTKIDLNGNIVWSRKYNASPGYKNLSFNRVLRSADGLIRTTYNATKISDGNKYEGFMDLEPSGNAPCLSNAIVLKEKNVPLSLANYATTVISISPAVASNTGTLITLGSTLTTVCASACNTYADMSISSTRVCAGDSIHVQDHSSNAISVNWLLDGVSVSSGGSYAAMISSAGVHAISIVATGASCQDTLTVNIIADTFPSAAFTTTGQEQNAHFSDLSSPAETYLWMTGDGMQFPQFDLDHSFSSPGTYTNCLAVSNACGSDTICHPFSTADITNFTFNAFYNDPSNGYEDGNSICQDPDGKLVVAAKDEFSYLSADDDIALLKMDETGKLVKQKMLYSFSDEYPTNITSLGSRGYCLLSQQGSVGIISIVDTAFSSQYSKSFSPWEPVCTTVSPSGSIYAGGRNGVNQGTIVKMSRNLNKLWAKEISGAAFINGALITDDGALMVVGKTPAFESYLAKIDTATGALLWSKYYSTSTGMEAKGIAYDPASNSFYIAGTINGSGLFSYNTAFIMRTDTSGNMIWEKAFGMTGYDYAKNCFVNQYGQIFLCHSGNSYNYITRLDTSGNILWTHNYRFVPAFFNLIVNGNTLCNDGGIGITGTVSWGADLDVFAIKTDTSGIAGCNIESPSSTYPAYVFAQNINAGDIIYDFASGYGNTGYLLGNYLYNDSIVCNGNTCAAYMSYTYSAVGLTYSFNYVPPAFPVTGISWSFGDGNTSTSASPTHTYAGPGTYYACLTGTIAGCGTSQYCDTITILSVNVNELEQGSVKVFPNPYTGPTNIAYSLKQKANVVVEVYNTVGQKIKSLVNASQPAGEYKYTFSAKENNFDPGIYFVKFTIDGKVTMKKIVEMK